MDKYRNTLICKTNNKITATVAYETSPLSYKVNLYNDDWLVANLQYETLIEAESVAYEWASNH